MHAAILRARCWHYNSALRQKKGGLGRPKLPERQLESTDNTTGNGNRLIARDVLWKQRRRGAIVKNINHTHQIT
jgi:hypothetical protein